MKSSLWLRRAWLFLIPLVLAGGVWKIHDLQQPISLKMDAQAIEFTKDGSFGPKRRKVSVFKQMISRLSVEAQNHPYASSISIGQVTPWPKESHLDLVFSESLDLERKKGTLSYSRDNYGWVYSNVENSGIDFLSRASVDDSPITLPAPVDTELHKRGWTLTEHYTP